MVAQPASFAQTTDSLFTQPSTFYLVGKDTDFPPVNPISVKVDSFGNIHSWFFYIEPSSKTLDKQLISIFYSIAFANGSNFVTKMGREKIIETKLSFLQNQDFVETSTNEIFNIYIQSSDFGINLIQFKWDPENEFRSLKLQYPSTITFDGPIIGPREDGDFVDYFLPGFNRTINKKQIFQLRFLNGSYYSIKGLEFPFVILPGNDIRILPSIFDIVLVNKTKYYLGGFEQNDAIHSLILMNQSNDGEFNVLSLDISVNVAPIVPGILFFDAIRVDIIKPQLEATENGKLYSFIFSLNEDQQIRKLVEWINGTQVTATKNVKENPFLLSFLPLIQSKGNDIQIAALGIQFAQDIFAVTVDKFTFNSETKVLEKVKIQHISFSSSFFLFAVDLSSSDIVGMVATISVPNYLKENYNILNNTVGSLVLFSNKELPKIEPYLINVVVANLTSEVLPDDNNSFLIILFISILVLSLGFYIYSRRRQISLPSSIEIKRFELYGDFLQNSSLNALFGFFELLFLYLKTNRRRIIYSIFILILPTLILMSLLTGLFSHQQYLIQTYENQNPLNGNTGLNSEIGDFMWTRSLYDDEFSNTTIDQIEWQLPKQLSKLFLDRVGVGGTIESYSTTTIFPLFEKRNTTFINDQNKNETINYPFPTEFAVIDESWNEFISSQLIAGRMPTASNEILLQQQWYVPRDAFNLEFPSGYIWDINSEIKFFGSELDIYLNSSISGLSQSLKVVGLKSKVDNLPNSDLINWASKLNTTISALRNLDKIPFYLLPDQTDDLLNNFSRLSIRPTTYIDLRYNVFDLEREEIPEIINSYNSILTKTLQETGIPWIGNFTDTRIIKFLEGYFEASRNIELEGSILIIPVLGLTLLITYEGLGISRSSIEEELIRFKREGVRNETIIGLFFFERSITSLLATSIASLFVLRLTEYFLKLTGFFETNPDVIAPVVTGYLFSISIITFLLMTTIGIIISIGYLFNFQDWRYQKYLGGYKRDISILISSGFILWISFYISGLLEDQIQTDPTLESLDSTFETIILAFRIFSLLIGVFVGVLILSKIINTLFTIISRSIWRMKRNKTGLLFNGISSNMGLYGRILIVFMVSFFLIVPMVTVPQALNQKYEDFAYYEFGTDITVDNWEIQDVNVLLKLDEIDEIKAFSSYFFGNLEFANGLFIRVFAIDPETFSTALTIPDQFKSSYGFNLSILNSLQDFEIITNLDFVDRNPIEVGDSVLLGYPHNQLGTNLTIVETFNEFPILKNEIKTPLDSNSAPLQMVTSLSTIRFIRENYLVNSTDSTLQYADLLETRNVALKIESLKFVDEIANELKILSGSSVHTIQEFIKSQRHPFYRTFEFIAHVSIFIGFLAPILSVIIISRVLFERRKFELEVYRRNGMNLRFFLTQISFELILGAILPSIIGLFIGSYWSVYYGAELFGEDPASLIWRNDNSPIWIYTFSIILISVGLWVYQFFIYSKDHIKEIRL